ncbi:unnamed protein product [Rotaria magnacalcarata]
MDPVKWILLESYGSAKLAGKKALSLWFLEDPNPGIIVLGINNQPSKISNTCSLFVSCFGLCCGELYSIMVLGMLDKWLRIKLGATYNYLVMFSI